MNLFQLFRSFLPLRNPIGFGASDFLELLLAVTLVTLALVSRSRIGIYARALAQRTGW